MGLSLGKARAQDGELRGSGVSDPAQEPAAEARGDATPAHATHQAKTLRYR